MWTRETNSEHQDFPDYVFINSENSSSTRERLRIVQYPNHDLFTVYYFKMESTGKFLNWANEIEWEYTKNYSEELSVDEIKEKYNLDI